MLPASCDHLTPSVVEMQFLMQDRGSVRRHRMMLNVACSDAGCIAVQWNTD